MHFIHRGRAGTRLRCCGRCPSSVSFQAEGNAAERRIFPYLHYTLKGGEKMSELIERIEKHASELRAMAVLCDKTEDAVAVALEPGLEKLALELTEIGLQLRSLQA